MRKEVKYLWDEINNPSNNDWLFDFFSFFKLVMDGEISREELRGLSN